jgi:hypothetical protein
MSEQPNRTNIPLPMKREVRQRCGFGCVICGLPLYEYEHMEEWAQVKRHVAEEITLLCDKHHTEKTKGLLPKEAVAAANQNPYNLREGSSTPYHLHYSGQSAQIVIGGNSFASTINRIKSDAFTPLLCAILIDNIPIIAFTWDGDELLLSIRLFDRFNSPILHIWQNQLIYKPDIWDIEFVGTTLTLRENKGEIFVELEFSPPNKISILRGRLMCNGVELKINKDEIFISGINWIVSENILLNHSIGLAIGEIPKGLSAAFKYSQVDRYNS